MPKLSIHQNAVIGDYNSSNVVQNLRAIRASAISASRGQSINPGSDQMLRGVPRRGYYSAEMSSASCTTPAYLYQQVAGNAAARTLYMDHLWAASGLNVAAKASGVITATPQLTASSQNTVEFRHFRGDDQLTIQNCAADWTLSAANGQEVQIDWSLVGRNTGEAFVASGSRTAITEPTTQPLQARNATIALTLAGTPAITIPTLQVRNFTFSHGAQIQSYADINNAIGFAVPVVTSFRPTLSVTVDAFTVASGDNILRQLFTGNRHMSVVFTLYVGGSTSLDSMVITMGSAQIVSAPSVTDDGGTLVETLEFMAADEGTSATVPYDIDFVDEVNN